MYEIEIPIIIKKKLATYEHDFFARDYHAYMECLESSYRKDTEVQARANKRGGQICSRNNAIKLIWQGNQSSDTFHKIFQNFPRFSS